MEVSPEETALREHFSNEPMFLEVINTLLEWIMGQSSRKESEYNTGHHSMQLRMDGYGILGVE